MGAVVTRRTDIDATALLFQRRRDAQHAHLNVECPRCHNDRTFTPFVAPDPQGRAQARAEAQAKDWLQSHPCQNTTYAHIRPVTRRAA